MELIVSIEFIHGSRVKRQDGKRTLSDALFSIMEGDDNGQSNTENKAL